MQNVFFFGGGQAEGSAQMSGVLGGKGANLHEMTRMGIPVPPGFTISAHLCQEYLAARCLPNGLREEVNAAMTRLEAVTERRFGDAERPLLVSVRSGAQVSMPGMMDTILNLGLNDKTAAGLAKQTKNDRFSYDCYRLQSRAFR